MFGVFVGIILALDAALGTPFAHRMGYEILCWCLDFKAASITASFGDGRFPALLDLLGKALTGTGVLGEGG